MVSSTAPSEETFLIMHFVIIGVGPTKASEWYHAGMRTLDDVINHEKFGITLTDGQRLGLQHFSDLNERMPRAEVTQHFKIIKDAGKFRFIAPRVRELISELFFSFPSRPVPHR